MSVQTEEIRTANKQHHCDSPDCETRIIAPGEKYRRCAMLVTHEIDEDGQGGWEALELPRTERTWVVRKSHLFHEPESWW